jgi:mono/diheme cytochrome c family protein
MRLRRFVSSSLFTILLILCLGLLGPGRVYANPVYADEQSLNNGAQLYQLHCSECHGLKSAERSGAQHATNETRPLHEKSALMGTTPVEDLPQVPKAQSKGDWPAWAKRPDPGAVAQTKPDARVEILNEVNAAINKAYSTAPEQPARQGTGAFNSILGVTDLSDPAAYFYGTSEEELFNSIANGTGAAMPGWSTRLENDEAIWDLVNYIRSYWSEEWLY